MVGDEKIIGFEKRKIPQLHYDLGQLSSPFSEVGLIPSGSG